VAAFPGGIGSPSGIEKPRPIKKRCAAKGDPNNPYPAGDRR